jgi:hypothetical protein
MKGPATLVSAALLSTLLLTTPGDARAEGMNGALGARIGFTDDPTSLQLGIFYEIMIAQAGSGFFAIEPGADIGFGDEHDVNFWTLRGTLNAKYLIPINEFFLYPIFGLSLWYVNVDCNDSRRDCDDTEAGINLGLGFRVQQFSFELTAGLDDIPDLFFSVGYTF